MTRRAASALAAAVLVSLVGCDRAPEFDEGAGLGIVSGIDRTTPRAEFLVEGLSSAALDGGVQRVLDGSGGTVRVLVLRDVAAGVERFGVLPDGAEQVPDVDGPTFAPPDGLDLGLADAGGEAARPVRRVAEVVGETVRARVAQRRVVGGTPEQTWTTGEGDCTEVADLTAAILRGLGIPARVAAGVAPYEGELRWHAWVEYWDGRWATLDPTFGQHPADAGHVRLDFGPDSAALDRLNQAEGRVRVTQVAGPRGAAPARP